MSNVSQVSSRLTSHFRYRSLDPRLHSGHKSEPGCLLLVIMLKDKVSVDMNEWKVSQFID